MPHNSWNVSTCGKTLYTAFFLSGLCHSFGAPFGLSILFFLANAVAITFGDVLIAVARRLGPESAAKLKGKEGSPRR
ncbi:hypothetical protein LXA43DRAFT_1093619 [Ganoderma leucocontextum]|nr:hypothetical protein LXA43DRAFT_1093619 [Ganoderma leucocontextum]